jgi:hypothetical protein
MDRVAVFVDAGYLFAQGSALLSGQKRQRGDTTLDAAGVVASLKDFAEGTAGLPLLRIYWYDGTSVGPTVQHVTIAHMPTVKLRLGFVNSVGEQKGVDSLIITDMISLARNGAMADAVLLSGDEDLRVGVQQAQEFGVRVHLLGIKPSRGSQSLFLLQEADSCHEWGEDEVKRFLAYTPRETVAALSTIRPKTPAQSPSVPAPSYDHVAAEAAGEVPLESLTAVVSSFRSTTQIPREFDSRLLARARNVVGRDLDPREKKDLRTRFVEFCETRLSSN